MIGLSAYLPSHPGWLPYWLLLTSSAGIYMSIGNFLRPLHNRIIYTGQPEQVTPLSGRTFGIWTLTSAVARILCAYHVTEPTIFKMAICTYLIAWLHFGSEFLVFKTTKIGGGLVSPIIVAGISLFWMTSQYDYYVQA